jgi:uncharacterized membrane protein YfcA
MFKLPTAALSRVFGGVLIGYVIFLFFRSSFRIQAKTSNCLWGGGLSGFLAGLFGMGGAVRSMFLSAFDLPKAVYVAATGAIAFMIDSTRLAAYFSHGVNLDPALWWAMGVFIPASLGGVKAADPIVARIPQRHFRKVVAVFLLLAGIKLMILPTS